MQPNSIAVLLVCVVIPIAAFAFGLLMDFKILDPHVIWRELAKAEELATDHREFIIQKWPGHINR